MIPGPIREGVGAGVNDVCAGVSWIRRRLTLFGKGLAACSLLLALVGGELGVRMNIKGAELGLNLELSGRRGCPWGRRWWAAALAE